MSQGSESTGSNPHRISFFSTEEVGVTFPARRWATLHGVLSRLDKSGGTGS